MNTEDRDNVFYNHVRVYRFLRTEHKGTFHKLFKDTASLQFDKTHNGMNLIEHIVKAMENNK